MPSVKTNAFAQECLKLLNEYSDEVSDMVSEETLKIADEGVNELKTITQPTGIENPNPAKPMKRRDWKNYCKGWEVKTSVTSNFTSASIWNRKKWQLTHLLEYGHATKDGKMTRAFPHIEPLSTKLENKLYESIKKSIEKGGNK